MRVGALVEGAGRYTEALVVVGAGDTGRSFVASYRWQATSRCTHEPLVRWQASEQTPLRGVPVLCCR